MNLPELPTPAHRGPGGTGAYFDSYTADQMRAYGEACAAQEAAPLEWRWVDDKGRALTNWTNGPPPPVLDLSDAKGTMHVEARIRAAAEIAPSESKP